MSAESAIRRGMWRRPGGILTSLRGRVFVAVLAVALVPVAVALGWAVFVELENAGATGSYTSTTDNVLRAWAVADDGLFLSGQVPEADVHVMETRLSEQDYAAFTKRLTAFLMATDAYAYMKEVPLADIQVETSALETSQSSGILDAAALNSLLRDRYYWGMANWWTSSVQDGGTMWSGLETPIVAWMPADNVVNYVHVEVDTGGQVIPPWWWYRIVGAVTLAAVIVLAAIATWLAVRGSTRPLRQMAAESVVAESGGDPQTVPATGVREVRELATVFNAMAVRTSRAQEAEQSFLLSVSHELKTPLTAIKGYGETLAEGRSEPRVAGEVIVKEASRLQRLVQDVLDLGRARKSSFSVRAETVDLALVAREVYERYAPRALEYGLELKLEAEGSAPVVADADRVMQIVSNLVENALRCTPAEGAVTIRAEAGDVCVSDTGPGLTRDDLARAFDRFYLYERYGKERPVGTGLGLAIVDSLTRAMGGTVNVESTLGVGTTFTVSMPQGDAAN